MKKLIRNWIDKKKNKYRRQRDNDIRDEFKVVELDGKLWITHNGTAFAEIDSIQSADEVANRLLKARETAIRYDKLKSVEDK